MKAKLILPLDPYVKAYGWDKWWGADTNQIFQWTEDGKTFGQGPTWGIAQTGQNVGLYVNKKKLADLGPDAIPATFAEFDTMLADAKSKLPRTTRSSSSATRRATARSTSSAACRARTATPSRSVTGSTTSPGSTFETPQNIQALTKLAEWGKNGYFNEDYNAVGYDRPRRSSPRARASSSSAATGTRRSSRRASAPTPA